MVSASAKKRLVSSVVESGLCSVRRACRYLSLSRSSWHYRERGGDGKKKLIERIIALSRKYPRYGYRRIRALLMREGWKVGRKLVQQFSGATEIRFIVRVRLEWFSRGVGANWQVSIV